LAQQLRGPRGPNGDRREGADTRAALRYISAECERLGIDADQLLGGDIQLEGFECVACGTPPLLASHRFVTVDPDGSVVHDLCGSTMRPWGRQS